MWRAESRLPSHLGRGGLPIGHLFLPLPLTTSSSLPLVSFGGWGGLLSVVRSNEFRCISFGGSVSSIEPSWLLVLK